MFTFRLELQRGYKHFVVNHTEYTLWNLHVNLEAKPKILHDLTLTLFLQIQTVVRVEIYILTAGLQIETIQTFTNFVHLRSSTNPNPATQLQLALVKYTQSSKQAAFY
jgi:hypothetical protein